LGIPDNANPSWLSRVGLQTGSARASCPVSRPITLLEEIS